MARMLMTRTGFTGFTPLPTRRMNVSRRVTGSRSTPLVACASTKASPIKKMDPCTHAKKAVLRKLQLKERGMWIKKKLYVKAGMNDMYVMISSEKDNHFQQVSRSSVWFHKTPSKRASSLLGGGSEYKVIKKQRRATPTKMIDVVPVVFRGHNKEGDFSWMIKQPKYEKTLFIYNDNMQEFDSLSFMQGGGNAVVRPYKRVGLAFGIPTGDLVRGGFMTLDGKTKEYIEYAFHLLVDYIAFWEAKAGFQYERIVFSSADEAGSKVGTGIFRVGEDVATFIANCMFYVPKALYTKRIVLRHIEAGAKFKPNKSDFFFHKELLDESYNSVWNQPDPWKDSTRHSAPLNVKLMLLEYF